MTLIDLFRDFSFTASMNGYPTAARTLYYTMLYVWNERRRPATVQLTAKELYALAGLTDSTARKSFAYLSDRGWVKRRQSRNSSIFAYSVLENGGNGATIGGSNAHATRETEMEKNSLPKANSFPTKEVKAHDTRPDCPSGANPSISDLDGIPRATSTARRIHHDPLPEDIF